MLMKTVIKSNVALFKSVVSAKEIFKSLIYIYESKGKV